MKETLDRETVQSVFSELEEQHTDMIDSYYSFHNGLILLKQCLQPSSRYPVAPDCEIPNSVIRGLWKEETYEEEEEVYVADYHLGFISSRQLLVTGSSDDLREGPEPGLEPALESEPVSVKENKKVIFQKQHSKSKQSSRHKRISDLSKDCRNEDSHNPLFIDICNRLYNEEWFSQTCEVEFNAVIDELNVCLGKADSENYKSNCDYILELNSLKALEQLKVASIGEKLTHQLSNESNSTILTSCMQTIAALNLKSDINISLIKSHLQSATVHLKKSAKDALRTMGVRQATMRYTPQDSSSVTADSSAKEPPPSQQMSSIDEKTSEIEKVPSKETKSRSKTRSAKDSPSKGKKSKGKVSDIGDPCGQVEAVKDQFPKDDAVEVQFPKDDDAVVNQFPKEPQLETIIQETIVQETIVTEIPQATLGQNLEAVVKADEEPVSEPRSHFSEEPVLENVVDIEEEPVLVQAGKEEKEEVAEEVVSIVPEVLQEAKDLPEDTQVKRIEEKQEDFAKVEDFVEEGQVSQIPIEETEVLLDTGSPKLFLSSVDIVQKTKDDKEISKEDRAAKEKTDLDSELISVEESSEVSENRTKKEPTKQTENIFKDFKADKDFIRHRISLDKRDPPITLQKGNQESRHLKKVQPPKFFPRTSEIKESQTGGKMTGKKLAAKSHARNQATIQKQKQRHERDLQNREKIANLFDAKKENCFLTKDSNKTCAASAKKAIYTKTPGNVAPVDKLRSSLLPFSKGGRGYDSFVKELNSIDKLPKKTILRIHRPQSMLGTVDHVSCTDYQASMQIKMESGGVPSTVWATTAVPPAESLLPAFATATLPFESSVTAFHPVSSADTTAIPPAATVRPPATTAFLPGSTAPLPPGTAAYTLPGAAAFAPDEGIYAKYPGSNQQMVKEKFYPGIKNEVPVENETSWIDGVLNGYQGHSEEEPQRFSKTHGLSNRRSSRKKEIGGNKMDSNKFLSEKEWRWQEDGEKKIMMDSSKEWARRFTEREYGYVEDIGTALKIQRKETADTEKRIDSNKEWAQKLLTEEEWRWSEDGDLSRKRELRQKEMLDKKEYALNQRWIEKPDYSSIQKIFYDPNVCNLPAMMGSKQERQWSESDDWNKKRVYREKVIPDREEEYLLKNWGHDHPRSNTFKTGYVFDRRLAEVKDAELGWSESAGTSFHQKSPANLSNLEWSDKAFYPVDRLSPWTRYRLQYKPERIEEEIYDSNFEPKNVSQTHPEWFPKYRRMLFSPDFYTQREKWRPDYRSPTSVIY